MFTRTRHLWKIVTIQYPFDSFILLQAVKNAELPFMRTWTILTSTSQVDADMGEFVAVVKIYCNRPSGIGSNAAMAASCILRNTILPRLVDT